MSRKFILVAILIFSAALFRTNAQTAGQLTVTATTVSYGGNYAPHNVVAMWVTNKSGVYVKTMLAYAATRKAYLSGWGSATSLTYNTVDASTGATQGSHGVRTCIWNGANLTGTVLGDDTYNVVMEMTEGGNNKQATFSFKKGKTEQILTPANVSGFSNITIKWTPALTALEDVQAAKLFTVYPNPAKSSVYVNGFGIQEIRLYNLNGKLILKTIEPRVDISSLTNGMYILKIISEAGECSKSILKE